MNIPGGDSPMVPAPGGGFYVASYGGDSVNDYGAVYLVSPPSAPGGAWTQTALYSFAGPPDGAGPNGNFTLGPDGSLYDTTGQGGQFDRGTLYQLSPPSAPGGAWTETVLYTFGAAPSYLAGPGGLVVGSDGLFYGSLSLGPGVASCGAVFQLTPPSIPGGLWQEASIYTFLGGNPVEGCGPNTLIVAPEGGFYGINSHGGEVSGYGDGTVFALTPPSAPSGAWGENTLFSFKTGRGINPDALVLATNGSLYGTAGAGGEVCYTTDSRHKINHTCGTVFKLVPPSAPGGAWVEKTVHIFTGDQGSGHDGAGPLGLSAGPDGTMYGTTSHSGLGNGSTVFEVVSGH